MSSPAFREQRGRLAILTRHRGPDAPEVAAARRDLAAQKLEDHVRAIVAQAPPLTDEQRTRIARLLAPAAEAAAG